MSANRKPLRKLIEAARKAHAPALAPTELTPPLGFSTRVAARWASAHGKSNWAEHWERLCWWGASASVAVCVFAFVNQSFQPEPNPFDVLIEEQADAVDLM